MFGFGRKKNDAGPVTSEMIYRLEDVNRRFPGAVPTSGVKVGNLSLAIAMKVALFAFNQEVFDKVLLQELFIDRGFPSGWIRADALSRWYSLGFICVTDCFKKPAWCQALTVDIGTQVYDATNEKMWILWSMPDIVRQRVTAFMGQNIQSITSSLNDIVDARTNAAWFRRYAARVNGGNPPWEIRQGESSSLLEDLLSGERISESLTLYGQLSARYGALAKDIMGLVTGTKPLP